MGCSGSTGTKVISLNDDKKPQGKSNEDEDADKDIENTPQQPSAPKVTFNITNVSEIKFQVNEGNTDSKQINIEEKTTCVKSYSRSSTKGRNEDSKKKHTTGCRDANMDDDDAADGDAPINKLLPMKEVAEVKNKYRNPEIIEPVDPEHVTEASPGTDHDEGI